MEIQAIATDTATETRAAFTIDARALSGAVKLLSAKVTEKRNTIPIVDCVMIEAKPCGAVTLTATDLDIWATVTLEADPSEEIEPGALCLNAYALAKLLAKAAKNSDRVRIEAQDRTRAKLKAGRNEYKLPGLPCDDFPFPKAAELDCEGVLSRAWFMIDLKALAPAVSTEENRYYINGYALQVRELGGAERFAMVATNGGTMAAASRPIPAGLESWQDAILHRKAGAFILAADKVAGDGQTVTLSRFGGAVAVEFGTVRIVSKLIDGTFPQWQQAFERIATPTSEADAPLFPELLPGAPVGDMEKLAKAAQGTVLWESGNGGLLGTVAGDPHTLLACHRGKLSDTGRKGFSHNVGGHDEAAAYLKAIAEGLGLSSEAEIAGRVDAINAQWGKRDLAALNQEAPHCTAYMAGDYSATYRHTAMKDSGLITRGDKVLGYTVGGFTVSQHWTETRQNWETLAFDHIEHLETVEAIEGSYSVVMPDHGPQLEVRPAHYVDASDGNRYPIADNGSKIHLSADQLRALIGDSVWTVLEFPGADGKPRYVSQWLWDDGDNRFLCVGKDGRCPKPGAPREYVTREQVEAALAGDPVTIEPAPTAETESEPVAQTVTPTGEIEAPESAQERESETCAGADTGEAVEIAPEPVSGASEPDCGPDPIAVIRERLAEVEALLAALPAQSARPKRTPAHERAIRRAWAERKARRMAQCIATSAETCVRAAEAREARLREQLDNADQMRRDWMRTAENLSTLERKAVAKRRRAVLLAREFQGRAHHYRANWKEEARRAGLAEAENAQLWQEIEALTNPATPAPVAPMILQTLHDALEVECDMANCPDSELARRLRAAIAIASPPEAIAA